MRPDPEMIPVLTDTAKALKGYQKRLIMARTVKVMGQREHRWAEDHPGWSRATIRMGMRE